MNAKQQSNYDDTKQDLENDKRKELTPEQEDLILEDRDKDYIEGTEVCESCGETINSDLDRAITADGAIVHDFCVDDYEQGVQE